MRLSFLAALLLITASATARADCASSPYYDATVDGSAQSTVDVTLDSGPSGDACGGSAAMLRQNVDTGEVVQLAAYCAGETYLDECVAAGRYRYGFAASLACGGGCGGTPFFGFVDVTSDATGCTRSTGDAGPTPYSGAVPWTDPTGSAATDAIDYVCNGGGGCNTGGKLRVHVIDLLALCGAIAWIVRRRRR